MEQNNDIIILSKYLRTNFINQYHMREFNNLLCNLRDYYVNEHKKKKLDLFNCVFFSESYLMLSEFSQYIELLNYNTCQYYYKFFSLDREIDSKYVTPNLSSFHNLLENCKEIFLNSNNKCIIDIGYCKFTPETERVLRSYTDYIMFIDSVNPFIQSILEHNNLVSYNLKLIAENKIKIEDIPNVIYIKEIKSYLASIDINTIYRVATSKDSSRNVDVSILLAMCIQYLYPGIQIDLGNYASRYVKLFNKFWINTNLIKRDSYYILWYNRPLKVSRIDAIDLDGNNLFYIPGYKNMTEKELNSNFDVVPYEWGNVDVEDDPELGFVYSRIINELFQILEKKKKKLKNELRVL